MKNSYKLAVFSLFLMGFAASFAPSFAISVKGSNDVSFSFSSEKQLKRKVTYHLPKVGSEEYEELQFEVDDGVKLYDALDSRVEDRNNYTFDSWHLSKDHLRNDDPNNDKVDEDYIVNSDIDVYGKYIRENTIYYYHTVDKENYYIYNSQTDYELNAKEIFIGTKIFTLDGVEGHKYDLISTSGIYSFTKNSNDWTIKRKLQIKTANVTWWNASASSHLYCFGSKGNEWVGNLSFVNNVATVYVDAFYDGFILTRSSSTTPSWNGIYNRTVDIKLTEKSKGSEVYSKSHYGFYIESSTVYQDNTNKNYYSWW